MSKQSGNAVALLGKLLDPATFASPTLGFIPTYDGVSKWVAQVLAITNAMLPWPLQVPTSLGPISHLLGPSDQPLTLAGGGSQPIALTISGGSVVKVVATGLSAASVGTFDLGVTAVGWRQLFMDSTITGTVGAVTINKAAGRVIMASGSGTLVVTNSLVNANSVILLTWATATVAQILSVTAAAGSFTINANVAIGGNFSINFLVINS